MRPKLKKASSLPKHWPKPSESDLAERPQRIVNVGSEQDYEFRGNSIKTSKYEVYDFLPKFLFEQFNPSTKLANCYFLMIAGLQCIPPISNTGGYPTTLIPLFGVLLIQAILETTEDYQRHKADTLANSSRTEVLNTTTGQFETRLWSEVIVGDYLRIKSREIVPADLLVIDVWEPHPELAPKGVCYVETKSLDGETNLKLRSVPSALIGCIQNNPLQLQSLLGKITMEHPNNLIDSFTGILDLTSAPNNSKTSLGESIPLQPANIILRGCVLRSTDYMIGLVVNTGHDVKIMQSKIEAKRKSSNLELLSTIQIMRIVCLLLFLCFWASIGSVIWLQVYHAKDIPYLKYTRSPGATWIIQFFYYLLLHATFVPVSLYVSLATVQFIQARFITWDESMYYAPLDTTAVVRTMTLSDELGQVSHVLSDKTGTLTCNIMNYRKASIAGVAYGQGITEIGRAAWKLLEKEIPEEVLYAEEQARLKAVPHVAFYDSAYEQAMSTTSKHTNSGQYQKNRDFYRYLAVCHEVIVERVEGSTGGGGGSGSSTKLSAPNPDDEALVSAAAYFGYEFIDRRDKHVILRDCVSYAGGGGTVGGGGGGSHGGGGPGGAIAGQDQGKEVAIEVLYTIPFSSARKRMSVIIRDPIDGQVKVITKGADSMMFTRVDPADVTLNTTTAQHINQFSIEGLRCLIVAMAVIPAEKYAVWSKDYSKAMTDLQQLELRKKGLMNEIDILEDYIEKDLHVIGATAIEDRLQDGVPETIEQLTAAGIKVWILTGDKMETAINIAVACNLVLPKEYMHQVIIDSNLLTNLVQITDHLKQAIKDYKKDMLSGSSSNSNSGSNSSASNSNNVARNQQQVVNHEGRTLVASTAVDEDNNNNNNSLLTLTEIKHLPKGYLPRALIIDGPSLIPIMQDSEARNLLLIFTQCCQAVVCCRVSPDQKREIVELVKVNVPNVRTLAIGDGANDVAMITAAHVGVGIKGEEGVQAVNASDFAIGQFRFLSILILKHGRYNYIRMSNLICYMFYKNIFMSMGMYWYNFSNGFTGLKFYTEAGIQLFNLLYTSIPILLYAAYDQDLLPETVKQYPQLYQGCIKNVYFSNRIFWTWIITAVIESIYVSFFAFKLLQNFDYRTGMMASFEDPGGLIFFVVVIVANLKMFQIQFNWYSGSILAMCASIGLWILIAVAANRVEVVDYNFYGLWERLLSSGTFWLATFILVTTIAVKDVLFSAIQREVFFRPENILQERSQLIHDDPEHRQDIISLRRKLSGGSSNGNGSGKNGGGNGSRYGIIEMVDPAPGTSTLDDQ